MYDKALLLFESYSARLARQGLASGTRTKYLAAVEHYLSWLGGADAAAVTRQELDEYSTPGTPRAARRRTPSGCAFRH